MLTEVERPVLKVFSESHTVMSFKTAVELMSEVGKDSPEAYLKCIFEENYLGFSKVEALILSKLMYDFLNVNKERRIRWSADELYKHPAVNSNHHLIDFESAIDAIGYGNTSAVLTLDNVAASIMDTKRFADYEAYDIGRVLLKFLISKRVKII